MERAEERPVRVAEILDLIETGKSESAWLALEREARAIVRAGAKREDLVSELLVRSMSDAGAALRRADPEMPLRPWLATMAKNVRLESARERPGEQLAPHIEPAKSEGGAVPGWADLDLSVLTPAQREAWILRVRGRTQDEIASELGISRTAVRRRLDRAVRRLRDGAPVDPDRSWAMEMFRTGQLPSGKVSAEETADLLVAYAAGMSRADLARSLGVSAEAVRKRLRRCRAWWLGRRSDA